MHELIRVEEKDLEVFAGEISTAQNRNSFPQRINADADNVEKGLAKLVLTIVELLRQLLERQAIKRMDRLTNEEIERLGITFMRLEDKMNELIDIFGLTKEELNIDLGPLGDLL